MARVQAFVRVCLPHLAAQVSEQTLLHLWAERWVQGTVHHRTLIVQELRRRPDRIPLLAQRLQPEQAQDLLAQVAP